jgi:hypothetical protein
VSVNLATKARLQVGGLLVGNGPSDGGAGAVGGTGSPIVIGKISSVSATITPTASLLANTVYTTTVTLTGAATTDAIITVPPAAIAVGVVWNAYVSAANTVTIRIANPTGSTITTAAGSWTFVWIALEA